MGCDSSVDMVGMTPSFDVADVYCMRVRILME